jgi:uncharacterized membrane protein
MKATDIQRLQEAGFIRPDQAEAILQHYQLESHSHRFMTLVGVIGAILIGSGCVLVIASHWDTIPAGLKLITGIALLAGSHVLGFQLGRQGKYPQTAQAAHLLGSLLFLGNIALVGQVYHLSSRPPSAILLWGLGVTPLAWILRSRVQHLLSLIILLVWLGLEMNQTDSWIHSNNIRQLFSNTLFVGVAFSIWGHLLNRSTYSEFASITERVGSLVCLMASYPMTLGLFYHGQPDASGGPTFAIVLSLLAGLLSLADMNRRQNAPNLRTEASDGWMLHGGLIALAWMVQAVPNTTTDWSFPATQPGPHWITLPVLFGLSILQIRSGLRRQQTWQVNQSMMFIGLLTMTAYVQLFGSQENTGLMFLTAGILLVGLAVVLERQRRRLINRISDSTTVTPA